MARYKCECGVYILKTTPTPVNPGQNILHHMLPVCDWFKRAKESEVEAKLKDLIQIQEIPR